MAGERVVRKVGGGVFKWREPHFGVKMGGADVGAGDQML